MTLFGILWLGAMLYALAKKNIKYMLYLCLFNMTLQSTNVIVLGSLGGVGPQLMTSGLFVLKAISLKIRNGKLQVLKREPLMTKWFLVLLVLEIICSAQFSHTLSSSMLSIIQLLIYILCFFAISNIDASRQLDTYKLIRSIIVVMICFGVIQWLTSNNILPLKSILKAIIYNDNGGSVAFLAGSKRLYSTFMEPSYFAGFLVGSFFYLLSITDKWKENYFLMGSIFVELLLTRSSTGYGAFAILCVLFIITSKKMSTQRKILLILIGIIGVFFAFAFAYKTLDAVIFSKGQTGSAGTRNVWNIYAARAFMSSPILGTGYKTVRGSSIIYSLLGQIGIAGMVIYIATNLTMVFGLLRVNKKNEKFSESQGIAYAVLGCLLCEIIACPDLDLCTYWFWIYCAGLYLRPESPRESTCISARL